MYIIEIQIVSNKKGTSFLKVHIIILIYGNPLYIDVLTFVNLYISETERGKRRHFMRQLFP